ncbi:MAG TPA: NADH-quinone oxidoreductase subunit N [Geobacteraceae bacterium]|nr:NADH-quinone oxidoreductase subunit N [Geobacteraceae bacterium]
MTLSDIWTLMPLLIIACGALLVLLSGAILPGRYGTFVGVIVALGAGLWALQSPPGATPTMGMSLAPIARFLIPLFSLTAACTLLLSHDFNEREGLGGEEYPATVLFALFGMTVLVCAVNLLTLFLGLESLSFAFYILVAYDRNRSISSEAGLKYLLLGSIAAAFMAFGIALIYAGCGTLDIGPAMSIALAMGGAANPLITAGWGMLLIGLAFKVSLVPMHLWTPDVYQGGPTPVIAFLATASKGAGLAAFLLLLRGVPGLTFLHTPLQCLCFLSMTVGNLAALRQKNLKRMLAYSSIAQMGYVTLALLTVSADGFAAVTLYIVVYTAMNLAAFGAIASLAGKGLRMEEVADYRGIGYQRPFQGGILALAMLALAGIPPTAGFVGKFFIFYAAIRGNELPLAIFGILTAAVSVYFYLRVVVNLYMQPAETPTDPHSASLPEIVVLGAAGVAILVLGVWPQPLLEVIDKVLR